MAHLLDQGGLARAADPGHADEAAERDPDVDPLEVVLRRAADEEAAGAEAVAGAEAGLGAGVGFGAGAGRRCRGGQVGGHPALSAEVGAGQRFPAAGEPLRRAFVDHLAPGRPRPRPEVEHPIRGPDDLLVVLHHEDRVARVPQPVQDPDHAAEVARVEADARLVEHEQGIDERRAEGGGEVDALDLPAAQGAGLPVEGEIAEAHVDEIAEPRAQLVEEERGRLVEGGGRPEVLEEREAPVEREGAELVDGEGGARRGAGLVPARERLAAAARQPPVEGLRLEPGPAAPGAREVAAVAREEDPDVHPVALALEPVEEPAHPEPAAVAPPAVPLDDPGALLRVEVAPRDVVGDPGPLRLLQQVSLVGGIGLRAERLDRPFPQGQALVGDDEVVVGCPSRARIPGRSRRLRWGS